MIIEVIIFIFNFFFFFLLTSPSDIVSSNVQTLILNNYWSVYEVKHVMMLLIKVIIKVWTYIITSITACPIRLSAILVIMSGLTFKSDIILYIFINLNPLTLSPL